MSELNSNYRTCCRLCLIDKNDSMKSIFDDSIDDRNLPQKILALVAIDISSSDKLSTLVCFQCIEKLNDWENFKQNCSDNQTKLKQWKDSSDSSSDCIQIKEEPIDIDPDLTIPEVVMNGLKNESLELEQNYNDELPSSHNDSTMVVPRQKTRKTFSQITKQFDINKRKCTICAKLFSSVGNRKKHERTMHGRKNNNNLSSMATITSTSKLISDNIISKSIQIDSIQNSNVDSKHISQQLEENEIDIDTQKIQFAAGLKLLQRNSTPPISLESLSKIELSYIEKCKAMTSMYDSLICACHNAYHPNLKGLLSHLRSLRIWFPVFTCYHCMITFADRSSSTRHHIRCSKSHLETLIKLSNLRKRSEVKTRLYQNYKCTMCKFMYSFHEDFCTHVDEDHSDIDLPFTCKCNRIFNTVEDYKDHCYISCLVQYYCDICFKTVATLDEFQKHAVEEHDKSEGFILLQDDNYRRRSSIKKENLDDSTIVSGKRKSTSIHLNEYETKVVNPAAVTPSNQQQKPVTLTKIPGTTCPICFREYSNNHNMLRHYRKHQAHDDTLYCCSDCGGMFSPNEWIKHKDLHNRNRCDECGKSFRYQSELDRHRSVHLNLKVYRDSKTQAYKSTMVSPNSGNVVVMCEICDDMFTTKEQLRQHKLIHDIKPIIENKEIYNNSTNNVDEKPKKFSCTLCNKFYAGYGGLWDHNRKKHPGLKTIASKEFPKQCKYCDKTFHTGGSYFMHKQMHERMERNSQSPKNKQPNPISIRSSKVKQLLRKDTIDDEDEDDDDDAESYHTCKRCFKVFSNKYNLKNHMKCHTSSPNLTNKFKSKSKKVWCNSCHIPFDSADSLNRHKADEHNEAMSDIDDNMDMDMPFVFTCDICVQTFSTKLSLKRHKEKHARELTTVNKIAKKNLVYCKYCKISFESAEYLNIHMLDEHNEIKFKPPPSSTSSTSSQNDHVKKFTCPLCKKSFSSPSALVVHESWHKRISKKVKHELIISQFKCNTCLASFDNDTSLQLHILEKHRNVNATILSAHCALCNVDFKTHDDYEHHRRLHEKSKAPSTATQTSSSTAITAETTTMAATSSSLSGTIPILPTKATRRFRCDYCATSFTRADALNSHLHEYHSRKTDFKCKLCPREFEKQNSLSIHMRIHDKPKIMKYSCSICNKTFDLPKDLRQHTFQAHPF